MASQPLCSFSYEYLNTPEEIIDKLRETAANNHGTFDGNTKSGNFTMGRGIKRLAGNYIFIDDDVININITRKSRLVTCQKIDNALKNYFEDNDNFSTLLQITEEVTEAEVI